MNIRDLEPFKAEIVALGGAAVAAVGMLTDHELLSIVASAPGMFAMYGSYIKGKVSAEDLAKAIAREAKEVKG
jgi:hypothetical protein